MTEEPKLFKTAKRYANKFNKYFKVGDTVMYRSIGNIMIPYDEKTVTGEAFVNDEGKACVYLDKSLCFIMPRLIKYPDSDNVKSFIVRIRLSESEHDVIKKRADKAEESFAAFVRKSAIQSTWNVTAKTDILTVGQIRKIGINFNQLVKNVNTLHDLEIANDYLNVLKSVESELKKIYDFIINQ